MSPFNDGLCLFGAEQLRFAAVARHGPALQQPLLHQLVYIYRNQIRLDVAHLHDVAGCFVAGVIGQKHQNIKRRLRQSQLLTQRPAGGTIGQPGFIGKLDTGVHFSHRAAPLFVFERFTFEAL